MQSFNIQNLDKTVFNHLVTDDQLLEDIKLFGVKDTARKYGYYINDYGYSQLAGQLVIEHNRISTPNSFIGFLTLIKDRIKTRYFDFVLEHEVEIQKKLDETRHYDYKHDFFSANVMCDFYCTKIGEKTIERPQYAWMRCAIQTYSKVSLKAVFLAYQFYLEGRITPATPIIINSMMKRCQLDSCFLLMMPSDLKGVYKAIGEIAYISRNFGGVGLDMTRIGYSDDPELADGGVIPIALNVNDTIRASKQGNTRKGACTMNLGIWHYDAPEFISLTEKIGTRYNRTPDLNTAIWIPDLFMRRVKANEDWTMMNPNDCPDLKDKTGEEFEEAYLKYEADPSIMKRVMKATDLNALYCKVQMLSGMPYLQYEDNINRKSNQSHRGVIKCTNLCTEIMEFCRPEMPAACNLHSINLAYFVKPDLTYDFEGLAQISRFGTNVLNLVIDETWYPTDIHDEEGEVVEAKEINLNNKTDRPIGLGVAGLGDVSHKMGLPYESSEFKKLNKQIFSCIYYNSWIESVELAIRDGPYETFKGSPSSHGLLQPDLWKKELEKLGENYARKKGDHEITEPSEWGQSGTILSNGFVVDCYSTLREAVKRFGSRNCMNTAHMPTATSSSIRSVCETTEYPQSNAYSRKLLCGAFPLVNRYLQQDLTKIDLWNDDIVSYLKEMKGSIQGITLFLQKLGYELSEEKIDKLKKIELLYKTMRQVKDSVLIDLHADRAMYVDQAISLNLYPTQEDQMYLVKLHRYVHAKGLKGTYYTRLESADIVNFTGDLKTSKIMKEIREESEKKNQDEVCYRRADGTLSCCGS